MSRLIRNEDQSEILNEDGVTPIENEYPDSYIIPDLSLDAPHLASAIISAAVATVTLEVSRG